MTTACSIVSKKSAKPRPAKKAAGTILERLPANHAEAGEHFKRRRAAMLSRRKGVSLGAVYLADAHHGLVRHLIDETAIRSEVVKGLSMFAEEKGDRKKFLLPTIKLARPFPYKTGSNSFAEATHMDSEGVFRPGWVHCAFKNLSASDLFHLTEHLGILA